MKLPILFILLLLSARVNAQAVQKIKQLLKDKELAPLNTYITQSQKGNTNFRWDRLRTIAGDYQEGIIQVEEPLSTNDSTGESLINRYRVCLLTHKDRVFYYKFVKLVYNNTGSDQWQEREETTDSFTDKAEYALFENSFRQTYGDPLNPGDLFLSSIVYGGHCGMGGINPEYMDALPTRRNARKQQQTKEKTFSSFMTAKRGWFLCLHGQVTYFCLLLPSFIKERNIISVDGK